MQVERYIRAYHKDSGNLAFSKLLPSNSLTFLSTVNFLQNDDDPLLYYCHDLDTNENVNFIWSHFFNEFISDIDYFDYTLECDSVSANRVKTKEELLHYYKDYNQFVEIEQYINSGRRSLLNIFQELCYTIYQQGGSNGRL